MDVANINREKKTNITQKKDVDLFIRRIVAFEAGKGVDVGEMLKKKEASNSSFNLSLATHDEQLRIPSYMAVLAKYFKWT